MINDLDMQVWSYLLAPTFQFVNTAGKPLTEGYLEVYIAGTRNKYYCASDFNGTLHPFQIPLDSLGSNIVLADPSQAYDVYAYNRFGSLVMSRYNVSPSNAGGSGVLTITISSNDDTVQVVKDGNNYDLSIADTVARIDDIEDRLDNIGDGSVGYAVAHSELASGGLFELTNDKNKDIDYTGDMHGFRLKPGHVYQLNFNAKFDCNNDTNDLISGKFYLDGDNVVSQEWQFNVDNSFEHQESFNGSTVLVIPEDVSYYDVKLKYLFDDEALDLYLNKISIVDVTSIVSQGASGGGVEYTDGDGIIIVDNSISVDMDYINEHLEIDASSILSSAYNYTDVRVSQASGDLINIIAEATGNIPMPPEVPNVEITSPNGTIDVQSSTDVQTNTKTFTIDVNKGDVDYYIGSHSAEIGTTNYNITNNLVKSDGNLDITSPGKGLYLVCVNANVRPSGIRNEQHEVWLSVGPNNTYTMMHSLDWNNPQDTDISCASILKINGNEPIRIYLAYGTTPSVGVVLTVGNVSVYRLDSVLGQGDNSGLDKVYHDYTLSGDGTQANPLSVVNQGTTYTAGAGIDITNDVISTDIEVQNADKVNVNLDFGNTIQTVNTISTDGSTVRTDGFNFKLPNIKAGNGIEFTKVGTETTISMDSDVSDVVDTVEKLKQDLDTQITTNFDMPNISHVYDFADPSVSTLANGACMLCQSFTIPINHELRTTTDDADTPTLLGIYSQQNFAHKIMLALYEYTYAAEGEEHGSSTYVGDTGPVNVVQGVNEFPLKNRNPSITELRSDKVYYATLYLPNASRVNGLLLAGCSGYGNASIPAEPRLTCATENITWNGQELDLDDPTTTLNHYQVIQIPGQDPYYQYYIGPWNSGYNERQSAPRFYMQIRNGEYNVPVVPTVPFNDLGNVLPRGTLTQSDIPSFSPSQANSAYRDVTPLMNVTITAFEWIDGMSTCAGWAAANCVFDSGFANNLSGVSNSVVDLGQVVSGTNPGYAHRITFTTPLTLTAGTTYRFLCGCTDGSPYFKVWLDPTDVIYFGNNGWYVDISNLTRDDHHAGMYNKLYDNNNNHYVI